MKDFLLLVKAVKANSLTINRKKNGKTIKPKNVSIGMLLIGIFISFSFAMNYFSYFAQTYELGLSIMDYEKYIILSFSGFFLFGFFLCLTFSCSIFYGGNNALFLSLPISGNRLFLAKLFLSLYYNLIYGGLTILAISLTTCVILHLSFISYIYAIFIFFIYTISSSCASFLLLDFLSIFINFKNKKAVIVFSAISGFLGTLSIVLSSIGSETIGEGMTKENVIESMNSCYSYFTWISWVGLLPSNSILQIKNNANICFIGYTLISSLIVCLSIFVSRKNYISLLSRSIKSNQKKLTIEEKKKRFEKSCSNLNKHNKIALKREFSNYKNEGSILINAYVMPITMLISLATVMFSLKYSNTQIEVNIFQMMGIGFMLLTCCFYVIPYTSLSLEKKDLMLIKTLPYSQNQMVYIKLLPSYILYLPLIILNMIIYICMYISSPIYVVSIILLGTLYPILIINFSFLMGIIFPNFNYTNAGELLKKGWGVSLSYIFFFISTIVLISSLLISYFILKTILIGVIIDTFLTLFFSIFFFLCSKNKLQKLLESEIAF